MPAPGECRARRTTTPRRRGFQQGLISNLANPKIAVLFTSLLPQFTGGGDHVLLPFLLLGGLFVAMTVAWLAATR